MNYFLLKLFLKFHSLMYRLSGVWAKKAEKGLRSRHQLMNFHEFFLDNINAADPVFDIDCGNGVLAL